VILDLVNEVGIRVAETDPRGQAVMLLTSTEESRPSLYLNSIHPFKPDEFLKIF
jgi:hypothetical protein